MPEEAVVSASSLLGAAGEHHVMSQLLRRGFIAALAPAGVPNCDIVVTDFVGDRLCAVQVKTRRNLGSDGGWHMQQKHEALRATTLFYCFVDFGRNAADAASVHVVPAAIVAQTLADGHQAWLAQTGARGQQRNDSTFRRLLPDYSKLALPDRGPGWLEPYRSAWEMLRPAAAP